MDAGPYTPGTPVIVESITTPYATRRNRSVQFSHALVAGTDQLSMTVKGVQRGVTFPDRTQYMLDNGLYYLCPIFWGVGPTGLKMFVHSTYGDSYFERESIDQVWHRIGGVARESDLLDNTLVTLDTEIDLVIRPYAPTEAPDTIVPWAIKVTSTIPGRTPDETESILCTNHVNLGAGYYTDLFPLTVSFGWLPATDTNEVWAPIYFAPIYKPSGYPGVDEGLVCVSAEITQP